MSDFLALQEYIVKDINSIKYTIKGIIEPIRYKIIKLVQKIRIEDIFSFRQVPNDAASGYATIEKIEGNTVAWNQLLKQGKLVDMGLPSGLLWATCNIDITQEDGFASSPFQYGCTMFSWGNIEGHNTPAGGTTFDYNWGGVNAQEPWYEGQVYGSTPGSTLTAGIVAGDTYDAARYNLGSLFKMPTSVQFKELVNNCDFVQADGTTVIASSVTDKRVSVNGILGIYLKSRVNGNLIFFSASGYSAGSSWNCRGSYGFYWSASFNSDRNAQCLSFYSGGVYPKDSYNRYAGFAVRAVVNPNTIDTGHNNHKYYVTKDINHDLTRIFGSGYEPSTVAEFEAWMAQSGLPSVAAYNAGELLSVKMQSVKSVGFNQWDEEWEVGGIDSSTGLPITVSTVMRSKNFTRIIHDTAYNFTSPKGLWYYFYDDNHLFLQANYSTATSFVITTPSNAAYLRIQPLVAYGNTYNHDICINISDPSKNGTYEPYKTDSADIDVTTITGVNTSTNVREVMFSSGMRSIGSIYDTLTASEAVVKIGSITCDDSTDYDLQAISVGAVFTSLQEQTSISKSNNVSNRYFPETNANNTGGQRDMSIRVVATGASICIKDTARLTNKSLTEVRSALNGLVVDVIRATPITYTDLQDANGNPLNPRYKVEQGGTEQVLPVNTSTPTTVAPTLTTTYTKDVH